MNFLRNPTRPLTLLMLVLLLIGSGSLSAITAFAQTAKQPQKCVTIAGDSVAHGGAVYEIPNVGYTSVLTISIATLAGQQFKVRNIDLRAFDRSVGAMGISSPQKKPYLRTWDYGQLIRDRCQFTIIIPFVNDLTSSDAKEVGAQKYISGLVQMVRQLTQNNPLGLIFIGDFYLAAPRDFAVKGYAGGMTRQNVLHYNWAINEACAGALGRFQQVTCVNLMDVLPIDQDWYLEGDINHQDFDANLVSWVDPGQQPMLKYYWKLHPDGLLTGDHLHLNLAGKTKVAELFVGIAIQKQPLTTPPPPAFTPSGAFNATIAVGPLTMRSGPGKNFDVVFSLETGAKLVLDGRNGPSTWAHGTSEGGVVGWVAVQFLNLAPNFNIKSLPILE